jgi:hypothetical protein
MRSTNPPEMDALALHEAVKGPRLLDPLLDIVPRVDSAAWIRLVAAVSSAAAIMSGIFPPYAFP